jgi:hypothetical protein
LTFLRVIRTISVLALALGALWLTGCRAEVSSRSDEHDRKESREAAERFLAALKERRYDEAVGMTTPRIQSMVTPQRYKDDIEGRFGGAPVETWSFQSQQILGGLPRRVTSLYEVRGGTVERKIEIVTELVASPSRWQIASVTSPVDEAAAARAREAGLVVDQLLQKLKDHDFEGSYRFFSDVTRTKMPVGNLVILWTGLEADKGPIQKWELRSANETTGDIEGARKSYTMLMYRIEGTRGRIMALFTTAKEDRGWVIVGFDLRNDLPA